MSWRARAVFVSGTFRDMHAERDLLADRVFHDLEEKLAEHYTIVERVDLRVGIETRGLSDDHAKQEMVLKVCLEDVRRCRPFLIVLIGDRYGWVPPKERAKAAVEEARFITPYEGKSVTALEIEFGLWGDPDQQTRSRVYFRQLDYTGMAEADAVVFSDERAASSALLSTDDREKAAGRAAALKASKQRLHDDPVLGPRCRNYPATWDPVAKRVTGLGAFVALVIEDLLPEMIAEADEQVEAAKAGKLPTPLEQFVAERARGFKGRTDLVSRLCAHALDPAPVDARGLVLAGPSGGGKSAVFARVHEELSGCSDDDVWLLAHAAGIDPRSTSVMSLLEDWVAILATRIGIENPLAAPAEGTDLRDPGSTARAEARPKPDEVFADLLARAAAGHRVVLLLDALDRFERTPQAEHLTWLPPRLPANVRLIATAVPGPETSALTRRPDFAVEPLDALTADEAQAIAESIYGRYHRQPNEDAVRALLEKRGPGASPARGNALWLVSALEELNLLDGDDFRRAEEGSEGSDEDRLHAMVVGEARGLPADVEELYARVFARAGRRVSDDQAEGAALARAFTVTIALSRGGFRERDLAKLIPDVAALLDSSTPRLKWDALSFASLRRALRAHLVRRGEDDRWDFHHRQARSAAERAYLKSAGLRKQIHGLVANHLLGQPADDPLGESEAMHHLIQADAREKAARLYAGELTPGGLAGCRETLATLTLSEQGLAWVTGLLEVEGLEPDVLAALGERYLFDLNDALDTRAPLNVRRIHGQAVERTFKDLTAAGPGNSGWQRDLSVSHFKLGQVLSSQGSLPGALAAFEASRAINERLAAADPVNADWQRDLSVVHISLGEVAVAQGNLFDAFAAFDASRAITERLAAADPSNAGRQRDLSVSHVKLGEVLVAQGNLPGALAAFQASLASAERLADADPSNCGWQRDLSISHNRIGDVLTAQGDLPGAVAAFRAGLAIAGRLATADPGNAAWQRDLSVSHNSIGDVMAAQGNLPGAEAAFQAALAIRERLAAADPVNAGWQRDLSVSHNRIGDVLNAQGNLSGAVAAFQAGLALADRLAAADPGNAGWQCDLSLSHNKIGAVLTEQGDLAGAAAAFQAGLAIRERLAAADPGNAEWQRDLSVSHDKIGDLLTEQGNLPGAVASFQTGLALAERLAAADPGNAGWQRDLVVSNYNLANLLAQTKDPAAAKHRGACHAVLQRMEAAGMFLDPQLVQLLDELNDES